MGSRHGRSAFSETGTAKGWCCRARARWHSPLSRLTAQVAQLLLLTFAVGGCVTEEEPVLEVSLAGTVEKGLFSSLSLTATPIDQTTGQRGDAIDAAIEGQSYSVAVPSNSVVLLEASGTFTSEADGGDVVLDQPLLALVETGESDEAANVNLATTIAATVALDATGDDAPITGAELVAANEQTATLLALPSGTDPTQLSFQNISPDSTVSDPNLQLLLFSTAVTASLSGDALYADGFGALLGPGLIDDENLPGELLSSLNGLPAGALYDLAVANSGLQLPALELLENEVIVCNDSGCEFLPQAAPVVALGIPIVFEALGEVVVNVNLGQTPTVPVSVQVVSADGSATEDEDYVGVETSIEIPAGTFTSQLRIPLVVDSVAEGTETLTLAVSTETAGWSVLAPTVGVSVRDGAPSGLDGQNTAGLAVSAACLKQTGIAGTLDAADCLPLDGLEGFPAGPGTAALVEIVLDGGCTGTGACPQAGLNWLVDWFLVEGDVSGASLAELSLGASVYPGVGLTEADFRQTLLVSLARVEIGGFVSRARSAGNDLRLEARLVGDPGDRLAAALPALVAVPNEVVLGGQTLTLDRVDGVTESSSCPTGSVKVTGRFQLDPEFPDAFKELLAPTGSLCLPFASGVGGPSPVAAGSLDLAGAIVPLPETLSVLSEITSPATFNGVGDFPRFLFIPDGPTSPTSNRLLFREGWPFGFLVSGAVLDDAGIQLAYSDMLPFQQVDYSALDPRANGERFGNDALYDGVKGRSGALLLRDGELSGVVDVAAGTGNTAFPRANVSWAAFAQSIEGSALQPVEDVTLEYSLTQSAACRDPDCAADAPIRYRALTNTLRLDGSGYGAGFGTISLAQVPAWGARSTGDLAFSRPSDLNADAPVGLALAGFRVPADVQPAAGLLAHVERSADEIVVHYGGSEAYLDGNYLPTGLSVGPELYRDPAGNGQPDVRFGQDLTGRPLVIDNEAEVISLAGSVGNKYVIRNAGVTGVFNAAPAALAGAVTYGGYPLALDRFAVRLTDNRLDTYNWVDGSLSFNGDLGGPGGETFYFSNLVLNCAARLGGMTLAFERCDGEDNDNDGVFDENCGIGLASWQADANVFAAGFSSARQCVAADQQFTLHHDLDFIALDRPLPFRTRWTPAGSLAEGAARQVRAVRVDERPGISNSSFSVLPGSLELAVDAVGAAPDGRYGWLDLENSFVAVPFWDALSAKVRVANSASDRADVTLMAPGDAIENRTPQRNVDLQQQLLMDSVNLSASYSWGTSGFGFKLPVYYQPWQADTAIEQQSRFLGRGLTEDLLVLDVNQGINFIEPRRTRLSFGASANIAELKAATFSVDLNDPRSLRKVDDLLEELGVVDGPVLEPTLGAIQGAMVDVNELGNRGLEDLIRLGLEGSVRELGAVGADLAPNGQDPFVTISDGLARAKVYPQQVRATLEETLLTPLTAVQTEVRAVLRSSLSDVRNDILNASSPAELAAARASVAARRAEVQALEARLIAIYNGSAGNFTQVNELVTEVRGPLEDIDGAISAAQLALQQAVGFSSSICSNGFASGAEIEGYIGQAVRRFLAIRQVLELTSRTDLLLPIAELLADDPALAVQLRDSERRLRTTAEELTLFLNDAEAAVRGQVCAEDLANVLAPATQQLETLRGQSTSILSGLSAVELRLEQTAEGLQPALEALRRPLGTVDEALVFAEFALAEGRGGAELVGGIDAFLAETTENLFYRINLLVDTTDDPNLADLADALDQLVAAVVRPQLDELFDFVLQDVEGQLAGAYFSPEELRRLLVSQIMGSAPIQDLRRDMNVHFEELQSRVNELLLALLGQINLGVRTLVAGVESELNDLIDDALAPVRGLPLESVSADGFAVIAGDELERLHLGAEWVLAASASEQDPTTFGAALDIVRWGAQNGATGCGAGVSESRLDASISAFGMPMDIVGSSVTMEQLLLGFTLAPGTSTPFIPRGVFGGIAIRGDIGFGEGTIFDPAFAAGVGDVQNYLGASAGASFSGISGDAAFLVGRVCPTPPGITDVLTALDPDVARYITLPESGFAGVYLRGGASIPLIPGGCALTVGIRADYGAWLLADARPEFGGLVGGGAYGEVACIASIRGQVRLLVEGSLDGGFRFVGEGFGAAGAGFCEPETWTSVRRSRQDSWCGTGDAQFGAEFDGEWEILDLKVDSVF